MSVITAKLYDLASNELADISGISLNKTLVRPWNAARSFQIVAPAGHSLLTSVAADGYRNLRRGNRKLIVWEDGEVIFHGRVWSVERVGGVNSTLATITAYDPWMELGNASGDRAGRPVRDETGNLISPTFPAPISGPDLIYQAIVNSQGNGVTLADPNLHEGPLPIDLTLGTFDTSVPPAADLSCIDSMTWPVMLGDFIQSIVDTNAVDVDMRPLDLGEVADPYKMVSLSAKSLIGTDRSATVHFDYFTGSKNAAACRHMEDFSTICNKLYDFLGPRMLDNEHWKGSINPGAPGTTYDPTASRELYGGPAGDKGEFMWIRPLDSLGVENDARPLYIALWNAEAALRGEPRDLLYITPASGDKALFMPPQQFDAGDVIAINVAAEFGLELAESQRVYGYTKTWSRENVARVSELLTSADV